MILNVTDEKIMSSKIEKKFIRNDDMYRVNE